MNAVCDLDHRRYLETLQAVTAKAAESASQHFGIFRPDRGDSGGYHLTGYRIGYAANSGVSDVIEREQNIFYLGRMNLLAADVDQFRSAAQDTNVFAVHLYEILRVEPPIGIER
jgi:hypothetical protein